MTTDAERPEGPVALPPDLCRDAARLLARRLKDWLEPGERVEVAGTRAADRVEVQVRLEDEAHDRRTEAGVVAGVPASAVDPDAALALALDAADAFLGEWLEGGRAARHAPEFVEMRWQGRPVDVRLSVTRPAAEAEADRLLQGTD